MIHFEKGGLRFRIVESRPSKELDLSGLVHPGVRGISIAGQYWPKVWFLEKENLLTEKKNDSLNFFIKKADKILTKVE